MDRERSVGDSPTLILCYCKGGRVALIDPVLLQRRRVALIDPVLLYRWAVDSHLALGRDDLRVVRYRCGIRFWAFGRDDLRVVRYRCGRD